MPKNNVLSQLDLQVFLHVRPDYFNFAVAVEAQFMNTQVPVVASEIVEEHGNEILHWAFDVALAVRYAEVISSYVIVVANLPASRIIMLKWRPTQITHRGAFEILGFSVSLASFAYSL